MWASMREVLLRTCARTPQVLQAADSLSKLLTEGHVSGRRAGAALVEVFLKTAHEEAVHRALERGLGYTDVGDHGGIVAGLTRTEVESELLGTMEGRVMDEAALE